MKKLIVFIASLVSVFILSAHPVPCEGVLSWDNEEVQISYKNGDVKTMDIIDYYSDMADVFVISACDDQGAIMRVVVRESMFHFTVSIEHQDSQGVRCAEKQVVTKQKVS